MGYTIRIGQATVIGTDDPEGWEGRLHAGVREEKLEHAPAFLNDSGSQHSNGRSPGYVQWSDFLEQVHLKDLFFDPECGLMREHPGCFLLQKTHMAAIKDTLWLYQKEHPGAVPGFDSWGREAEDPPVDGTLARLLWLEWWGAWALRNCSIPAIENS